MHSVGNKRQKTAGKQRVRKSRKARKQRSIEARTEEKQNSGEAKEAQNIKAKAGKNRKLEKQKAKKQKRKETINQKSRPKNNKHTLPFCTQLTFKFEVHMGKRGGISSGLTNCSDCFSARHVKSLLVAANNSANTSGGKSTHIHGSQKPVPYRFFRADKKNGASKQIET